MRPKGLRIYYIIGVLVWFFVEQQHEGLAYLESAPRLVKNSVNFGFLILFGLLGYAGLGLYKEAWVRKLWVKIYVIVIILVLLAGLADRIWGIQNMNLRSLISYFRVFFTSPLCFGVITFLLRLVHEKEKGKIKEKVNGKVEVNS